MAEITVEEKSVPAAPGPPTRSKDEVALELMRFIAVTTGYGRAGGPTAGFSPGKSAKGPEEHAEALLELYKRCRAVVSSEPRP